MKTQTVAQAAIFVLVIIAATACVAGAALIPEKLARVAEAQADERWADVEYEKAHADAALHEAAARAIDRQGRLLVMQMVANDIMMLLVVAFLAGMATSIIGLLILAQVDRRKR